MKRILHAARRRKDTPVLLAAEQHQATGPEFSLWIAIAVYVLLSVLMTWPLVTELSTHVPTPDSDVFNVYWGNWWVRYALGNGQNPYWTDYLIYPQGFNLVSFAFSPFLALLWIPISWILPPLVAYNLLVLITAVLACVAMDQLVRYLTGNAWAALAAGITFGFAPALVAERMPHLNLAALFWIPWSMLLLTKLMREARIRDAILLAVVVALAFLTRPQVGVLVILFLGIYFVGLALVERRQWQRRAFPRLALAGVLSVVLLSPLLAQVWQTVQESNGQALVRGDADQTQTDLLAYVLPPPLHPLFGTWTADIYGQKFAINGRYWSYIGVVPLSLVLYAAISRRRKAWPWLLAGLFFFVLALGPVLRFDGQVYPAIKLPYALAPDLFAALGLNWPNRFNLALMAAVSVLVGLACAQIATRTGKPWLPGIAALMILGEYVVVPLPTILAPPHPAFYDQMAADGEDYAIVDLPLTRSDGEIHRYYQTLHHKRMVGGWDYRVPESAFAFIDANPLLASWRGTDPPGATLETSLADLAAANVRYVVIHKYQFKTVPDSVRYLLATLKPVYQDRDILVLEVPSPSTQQANLVQQFDDGLALIRPTVLLYLPWDGRPPLLSVYLCWLRQDPGAGTDGVRLVLDGPDGWPVYEQTSSLPDASEGMACQFLPLEWDPPYPAGDYTLRVAPTSGGQPSGTYSMTLPVFASSTRQGTPFPSMGYSQTVTFPGSMELLGYNLLGGDGFVWADLFLRSTARHQASYFLSVRLLDSETGRNVAHSDDIIPDRTWKQGDLYQVRRILWLNDVPPGSYSFQVLLQGPLAPTQSVEPAPEAIVILQQPLLVLPASAEGAPLPQGARTVGYAPGE
jgi:hypothetical protein